MSETRINDELDLISGDDAELDYNPLEFIDGEDDDEWDSDERRILPSALPPVEEPPRAQVSLFTPERAGSVENAVRDLVTTNAARRRILLSIIDWCRDGIDAEELFEKIRGEHADNLSVYEPMSYCRMLERAGAVVLEMPGSEEGSDEAAEPAQDAAPQAGDEPVVTYMGIEEDVKPVWRSTEGGLNAYGELTRGDEFREKLFGEDAVYCEVYLAVMQLLYEGGRAKKEITDLAETFEVTVSPRKWGAYFIDVLEAVSAIRWANSQWILTDLGQELLPELGEFCANR